MEPVAVDLHRHPAGPRVPGDEAVEVQARQVDGAGQQGECGIVERLVRLRVAPALDGEVGEHGGVAGADRGEEVVQRRRVFEDKGIGRVQDGLSFGTDLPVEGEQVRDQGWERGSVGGRVGVGGKVGCLGGVHVVATMSSPAVEATVLGGAGGFAFHDATVGFEFLPLC